MWYVKWIGLEKLWLMIISFILTMWYVKKNKSDYGIVKREKFYINYVVCKVGILLSNKSWGESFILTMWYVKVEFMDDAMAALRVLY